MDRIQAISEATKIAHELNWPWDQTNIKIRSWRIWPFSRVWSITSIIDSAKIKSIMRLNDRTKKFLSGRVLYSVNKLQNRD